MSDHTMEDPTEVYVTNTRDGREAHKQDDIHAEKSDRYPVDPSAIVR